MPSTPHFIQASRRRVLIATGSAAGLGSFTPLLSKGQQQSSIYTLVGTGSPGSAQHEADAGSSPINNPYGLTIGPDKKLYWCDLGTHRILNLDLETNMIGVVAGTGTEGYSGDGGPASQAQLSTPHEVRFDSLGDMIIAERDNHVVRKVNMATGIISTLAGNGSSGFAGDGGPSTSSILAQPHSIVVDTNDNIYICDIGNHRVRRIDADSGLIDTFGGTGETGSVPRSGNVQSTPLTGPRSIDIAPDGTLYLILREGNAVLSIDSFSGEISHLAGTGELLYAGDGGPASSASFGRSGHPLNGPKGIAYSASANLLFIVDTENHAIREINMDSGIITTIAGNGERGDGPESDPLLCKMNRPHGVFLSGSTLFIGDSENHRIRVLELEYL